MEGSQSLSYNSAKTSLMQSQLMRHETASNWRGAAFLDPPKHRSIINTALNQTTRPIDRSSRDEIEGNTSDLLLYSVRSQCLEDKNKLKKHPHAIDTPAVAVD